MSEKNLAEMRKHMDDYKKDIAMVKRGSLEEKPLAKAIEHAIYVWDLSARMQFDMTLEEVEQLLHDAV